MNYEKAKQALDNLNRDKQEQQDRLQLAAQAKAELDNTIKGIYTLHS